MLSPYALRVAATATLICAALVALPELALAQVMRLVPPQTVPSIPSLPSLAGVAKPGAVCGLKLSGRVFRDGEPTPPDSRIVRLKLEDSIVFLVIDPAEALNLTSQSLQNDMARETIDAIFVKQVMVTAKNHSDLEKLSDHADSLDRLRVDGCLRTGGFMLPIMEISSVRRSH